MQPISKPLLTFLALSALGGTMLAGCQEPGGRYVYNPRTGGYVRVASPPAQRVATNPYRVEEFGRTPGVRYTRGGAIPAVPGEPSSAPVRRRPSTSGAVAGASGANDGGGGDTGGGGGGAGGGGAGGGGAGGGGAGGGGAGGGGAGGGGAGGGGGGAGGGGGGAGGGGGGGGGWSDIRLKRNIERIGTTPEGFALYAFDYVWGGPRQVGVMAQEMAAWRPDAVIETESGYLKVDYGRLSMPLQSFAEWRATGSSGAIRH